MPTLLVTAGQNQDPVSLSVDVHGSIAATSIYVNGNLIRTIHDSFSNFYLGTNLSLKNNVVVVVTQVGRFPASMEISVADFAIDGAARVEPESPIRSEEPFAEGAPNVPHFLTCYFI